MLSWTIQHANRLNYKSGPKDDDENIKQLYTYRHTFNICIKPPCTHLYTNILTSVTTVKRYWWFNSQKFATNTDFNIKNISSFIYFFRFPFTTWVLLSLAMTNKNKQQRPIKTDNEREWARKKNILDF